MIDQHDASHDRLRLAVARAFAEYGEAELLDCLEDENAIVRTSAARRLHVRGTRSAFRHAVELSTHRRFEQREIAAFVLGQLGTPGCPYARDTFPVLGRLLGDEYQEVRAAAAGAIGSLGSLGHPPPREILDGLMRLAADDHAVVRGSVAFALGMIRDPAAVRCLEQLREDPDPDVRDDAEFGMELHQGRVGAPAASAPTGKAAFA